MYSVSEKFQDSVGHWVVRVIVTETRSVFLNFDEDPTQEQVDTSVTNLLIAEEEARNAPPIIQIQEEVL
jgi:hypothetical protein